MKINNIVFWGNLTIHVMPLAIALSHQKNVFIVLNSDTIKNNKDRKPDYAHIKGITFIDYAKSKKTSTIINQFGEDTIHINGALKLTNDYTNQALIQLLHNNAKIISLPQEGFQLFGIKKYINKLKWFIYINIIYRKIMAFGLTGENAIKDFKSIGCNMKRCFPFIYLTSPYKSNIPIKENQTFKIIFVGYLDKRKNLRNIIKKMINYDIVNSYHFEFHIYGGYGNIEEILSLINNHSSFIYHGIVPNNEVRQAMLESDLLILPSLYDGYGAVVNEGLQCGCRILVSNRCGSEFLIRNNSQLGEVFDVQSKKDFIIKLKKIIEKGPLSIEERQSIIQWSNNHISPNSAADYLINYIECKQDNQSYDALPVAPWYK